MKPKTSSKTNAKKKPPATDKTNETLVHVILDRSGSMASNAAGTVSGYNEYLNGLRADKDTKYNVSLIQFDAPALAPELTINYLDRPLVEVKDLKSEEFVPRGNTPLYDAIGEGVRRVEAKGRLVIVVVITDGMENASREFSKDAVKALIEEKQKEGWTFAFLGADIDSYAVGGGLGVMASATSNYTRGNERHVYAAVAKSSVLRSATARSHGVMAAAAMPMFDSTQRAAMGDLANAPVVTTTAGGPPPARTGFPNVPKIAKPLPRERREWKESS